MPSQPLRLSEASSLPSLFSTSLSSRGRFEELLANYNIVEGRLWPVVLATVVAAPFVWDVGGASEVVLHFTRTSVDGAAGEHVRPR